MTDAVNSGCPKKNLELSENRRGPARKLLIFAGHDRASPVCSNSRMRSKRILVNGFAIILGATISFSLYTTLHSDSVFYQRSDYRSDQQSHQQAQQIPEFHLKDPELKVTVPKSLKKKLEEASLGRSFKLKKVSSSSGFVVLKDDPEFMFRRNPNFTHSKCLVSIQKKLATLEWTKDIYHPEIHQIMHPGLMNMSEYDRLMPYWMPYGYKYHDTLTMKDLSTMLNLFTTKTDIISRPEGDECVTCAVVGNGGVMKGSGKGSEIDNHDFIFRVNNALRKGYETDVGSRTTHYVLMDRSLIHMPKDQVPRDEGIKYLFLPCRLKDYYYIRDVVTGASPKQKLTTDSSNVRIFHPDFIRYLQKMWMVTKSFRPTTGAVMFAAALHGGCDQISVYGMGFNTQYSEHYYDKEYEKYVNFKGSHDFQREIEIFKNLHRAGAIDWYTRDIASFQT